MRKVEKKKWSELPLIWDEMIDRNPRATSFQTYAFLNYTGKGKVQRKDLLRTIGLKELNLVLYRDDVPAAIAPLLIKKRGEITTVYFRGHFTTANYLDFIYADWSYEDFQFLMDNIREQLGEVRFFLDRVPGGVVTSRYLKEYLPAANVEEHRCYAIPIPESFDEWMGTLSKPTRHKIRNINSRLQRNQICMNLKVFVGEKPDREVCGQMIGVYVSRFLIKNKFRMGFLKVFIKPFLYKMLMSDKITKWLCNAENGFHVAIYLNDKMAAFTSGLIFKDRRILLSRLAINSEFNQYSPGGLLISETIKHLTLDKNAEKLNIDKLDLSQEDTGGKSYKELYGGELHFNYTFIE